MWLFDRRGFLVLATGAVAGCQFTPAYGPGTATSKLTNRVFIAEPQSEDLYELVKQVENRLGRASEPAPMTLRLRVSTSRTALGRTATGRTTRYQRTGTLRF